MLVQNISTYKNQKTIMKKSTTKNLVKRRSVGRPRKTKIKIEPFSGTYSENISLHTSMSTELPVEKVHIRRISRPLKSNSDISEVCSSSSMDNIVYQPPIAKSTSVLLRNMLLSSNRNRFNRLGHNNNCTSNNNNSYYNYYQYDGSRPLNLEISHKASSFIESSCKAKWRNNGKKTNIPTKEIKSTTSRNKYLPNLQAFPDIPQLADVDVNASFEFDHSNYSMNDYTDTDTVLCIDDSDTLSNQSVENVEQEQREFDQRWAMSIRMENREINTPIMNCETFNSIDDGSLLGPQDTALVQNDVIQNYIETNDVQFMQLPDSSCEVIRTLQYYETRLLTNSRSYPEHLQNYNVSINEQSGQDDVTGSNHTIAEFANMLPCPIAGCLWYSHSATLYLHLFTCHQDLIYYGNSITHVFRCLDIQNYCFFTHLQYVQNTIYIITVAFDCYSHTFVATIQHVSSYGDNTSVSPTTAVLTTTSSLYNNIDQHSWSGHVQPYSVPLDVLHSDGRCLFIDSTNSSDHVIIYVNLTVPSIYSTDQMFACL